MSDDITQGDTISVDTSTAVEQPEYNWKDSVDESYRDSVKDFKDINGLVKSYQSAQSMLGSSIRIPTDDASKEAKDEFYSRLSQVPGLTRLPNKDDPEAMNQFYNSLGRPESKDGYKIAIENLEVDVEA